jgi:phage tail-like protein
MVYYRLTLDEVKGLIDAFPVILNVDKTDADYLPLIAALVGIDFNYDIPIPRQREEIKRAVEVYKAKGTITGIKTFGRTISGLEVAIQEWPRNILMSNDPGTPFDRGNYAFGRTSCRNGSGYQK